MRSLDWARDDKRGRREILNGVESGGWRVESWEGEEGIPVQGRDDKCNGELILQVVILILYLFQQRRQINRLAICRNGLVEDGHFLKLDVGVEGSL